MEMKGRVTYRMPLPHLFHLSSPSPCPVSLAKMEPAPSKAKPPPANGTLWTLRDLRKGIA
jgi:hypothetical protein